MYDDNDVAVEGGLSQYNEWLQDFTRFWGDVYLLFISLCLNFNETFMASLVTNTIVHFLIWCSF